MGHIFERGQGTADEDGETRWKKKSDGDEEDEWKKQKKKHNKSRARDYCRIHKFIIGVEWDRIDSSGNIDYGGK